jgi:hypothetical protein
MLRLSLAAKTSFQWFFPVFSDLYSETFLRKAL